MSDQSNDQDQTEEAPQPEVEKVVETTETHVEAPDPERHVDEHRADPEVVETTTTTTETQNSPGEQSDGGE